MLAAVLMMCFTEAMEVSAGSMAGASTIQILMGSDALCPAPLPPIWEMAAVLWTMASM